MKRVLPLLFFACVLLACSPEYDTIIRNGTIYDGTGGPAYRADVGIKGDTIAFIGDLSGKKARQDIDATGLAVAPGFINMLSWAGETLLEDGRSLSDIKQGVTLEVFGEGTSMGPISEAMRAQRDSEEDRPWTTLGEYLDHLTQKGVSTNVASFVGATTVRIHELGYENRPPTGEELIRMQHLVRQAMEEGAMGVGASLIYAPADYASTEELIALCKVAAEYGGMYITHMRSEGSRIYEAVDETIRIAREAGIHAEIYHLKASQEQNWHKMDSVIEMIAAANAAGLKITANMYTYPASSTGLTARVPTWAQEGGLKVFVERLADADFYQKVVDDMQYAEFHSDPTQALLVNFKNDSLKALYKGKNLKEIAERHGKSAEETVLDLIRADASRIGTIYFHMSEENTRRQLQLPYVSLGSDGSSLPAEGKYLEQGTHPRAYGNFARFLGKYIREEKIMSLEEGVYRMTGLPASHLQLKRRGQLKQGFLADVVVFDPATVRDKATYEDPHQLAEGVLHVWVNGIQVLRHGEHTGAMPGRVVRGPGWKP